MRLSDWTRATRVALLAGALVSPLGQSAAQRTGDRQSDVIYGRKFGVALTMEVLTPAKPNGIGVLWVVSSSGRSSRDQTLQASFARRTTPLLDRGYTIFAVIHGSAPVFNVQDQIADVRRAIKFVRHRAQQFKVDGGRLGIVGSSSGGLLALLVALEVQNADSTATDSVDREPSRVAAVASFFPPTDLLNFGVPAQNIIDRMQANGGTVDPSFQFYDFDVKTGARKPITDREGALAMLREFSPVTHVTADDPPTFLVHGDQDRAVPIQQSRQLEQRLMDAHVPVRLIVREGVGHAYSGWELDAALVADWFDTHLRRGR